MPIPVLTDHGNSLWFLGTIWKTDHKFIHIFSDTNIGNLVDYNSHLYNQPPYDIDLRIFWKKPMIPCFKHLNMLLWIYDPLLERWSGSTHRPPDSSWFVLLLCHLLTSNISPVHRWSVHVFNVWLICNLHRPLPNYLFRTRYKCHIYILSCLARAMNTMTRNDRDNNKNDHYDGQLTIMCDCYDEQWPLWSIIIALIGL